MEVSNSLQALGRPRGNTLHVAIGLALLVVSHAALAQVSGAPSPSPTAQDPAQRIDGYYDRRTELQPRPAQADPLNDSAVPSAQPAAVKDETVRFTLKDVHFSSSVLLTPAQLDALSAPYKGRDVGMADLEALVAEVNATYKAKGITTAQAVLSAQALHNGVLYVDLIEGRLGKLSVEGARYSREGFVRQRLHQQEGEVVDTDQLRRDMVYLNRTTDLDVRALLRPGAQAGQTDVLINATEPQRDSYGVFVDNSGSDGTGRERIGGQAQIWGLLGVGDLLAGSVGYAQGGLEGQIAYSAIINRANGRLGVSVSRNQINIVNGPYRELAISGQSTSYGLDYRHPLVATQTWLLNGVASYARSSSSTDISGQRIADTTSNLATLGLTMGYRGEGRELSASASVSRVDTDEPLRNTTKFTIANGSVNWLQRFGQSRLLYRANLGFQYSSSDFVPSGSLFQLGGVGSVRGYERGVLAGPRGQFINLELHRPYGQRQDIYLFTDWGSVQSDYPKSASVKGAGLGVTGLVWKRLSYTLDLSHPLQTVVARQGSVRADFRISANW